MFYPHHRRFLFQKYSSQRNVLKSINKLKEIKNLSKNNFSLNLLSLNLSISSYNSLLFNLIKEEEYLDVIEIYHLLSNEHTYKNESLYITTILAYSGMLQYKQVCLL